MGTPTWLISHTHLDHIAALPVYVARRRMMKMEPPTIYLPAGGRRGRAPAAAGHAAARPRPAGVRPARRQRRAQEIELSREHVVTVFAHDAHDPVGRLRRLGPAQQAQGGVPRPARRPDPRPAPVRRRGDARGAHAAAGLHRRHQPGGPGQLPAGCSRRRS